MLPHEIKEQILALLAEWVGLYRVILFGSYAGGSPGVDSDIDLLVVTDDDFMPGNFEESMRNYLEVSAALRDIRKKFLWT